jgi:hypothetical protein
MKARVLIVLAAALAAALAVAAGSGAAADTWSLSLAGPNFSHPGDSVTFSGQLSKNGGAPGVRIVNLWRYNNATCTPPPGGAAALATSAAGAYSFTGINGLAPATYSFNATFSNKATSNCVVMVVLPPGVNPPGASGPPQVNGSFLCYSVGGSIFTAPNEKTARALYAAGYWAPSAVLGAASAAGAQNVGPRPGGATYHLVCMAPGTLGVNGNAPAATMYVDNIGDVFDYYNASRTGFNGVYPIVTATASTDQSFERAMRTLLG